MRNALRDPARNCPLKGYDPSGNDNANAVPVDFPQTSTIDAGDGDLHFTYAWGSSTGNLADLSSCTVEEVVWYPGTASPYHWPSPPFPANAPSNPSAPPGIPATDGGSMDDNFLNPSDVFVKPYSSGTPTFTATQYFSYECTNVDNGTYQTMLGPLAIVRTVSQNSNGSWKFTVTKPTNGFATINPLP